MRFCFFNFIIASFVLCASAEFYLTTLPAGTEVDKTFSSIHYNDISNLISYLLGLPSGSESAWKGVTSIDVFNRPKGNLLLNIYVPDELKFTLNKFVASYAVEDFNNVEMPSLEATNIALNQVFKDRSPMIVYFETDGKLFNVAKLNAPVLDDIPSTLDSIRARLENNPSVLDDMPSNSCLKLSEDADVYFLGELQTLNDILSKLSQNQALVDDTAPDSFVFSLTALENLVRRYGPESCQVNTAMTMLEEFVPKFIDRFDDLYHKRLLSEVNIVAPIGRLFNDVAVRHTRSLQQTEDEEKENVTIIGNVAEMLPPDYAVTVNLTFWVMVVFALATLAASYGIWFMNPGWDSVIYRMTTQRMKFD